MRLVFALQLLESGIESTDELSHIHLDSDACLLALEDPTRAASTAHSAEEGAEGAGTTLHAYLLLVACLISFS